MPPRSDIVLWLDLETSGSDDDALVLEVGMVVTGPGPEFEILDTFQVVQWHPELPVLDPAVMDMHTKNGLLGDIAHGSIPPMVVDKMVQWIERTLGVSKQHVVLAGSGVGHFDRKFIKRDWPWLDRRLAYYCYDVGVLRRFLRMVGITSPQTQTEQLSHRALGDVLDHIAEARALLAAAREFRDERHAERSLEVPR